MATNSFLKGPHTPIYTPYMRAKVNTTGSKTFTVYGVESFTAALNEDQAWMELYYLGTSDSVEWTMIDGRSIYSTTALASDTKAWTGTFTRKVKFEETVTVNKVGTYAIRIFLGEYEASASLWICPEVEVT